MSDVMLCFFLFFVKQKTAYEMRISDWSSDVCSSDLRSRPRSFHQGNSRRAPAFRPVQQAWGASDARCGPLIPVLDRPERATPNRQEKHSIRGRSRTSAENCVRKGPV